MKKEKKYKAFYTRYGVTDFEKFETLEKGIDYLYNQENEGNITAIGVYDEVWKICYFIDNLDIFGLPRQEVFDEKVLELNKLGIHPFKIEFIEKR